MAVLKSSRAWKGRKSQLDASSRGRSSQSRLDEGEDTYLVEIVDLGKKSEDHEDEEEP